LNILGKIARLISDRGVKNPVKNRIINTLIKTNNILADLKKNPSSQPSGLHELDEIKWKASSPTVINDHLSTLFAESLSTRPRLIVELGVERGFSTFVFERVARLCGARLVSVDVNDCSGVCDWKDWIFVQSDDIEFALKFKDWCRERNIDPAIDILFIDTDHRFEPTLNEIEHWFPMLSDRAKVFFHDSNLKSVYYRKDGSIGRARDYNRGVIQAIERYLNRSYNEETDFIDYSNGWLIKHHANCNGLAILEKIMPFKS
jgi:cephalosporin hydroxylase